MSSLVEIGPVVLEKKMIMWKVYKQTDRRTDDGRLVIRKAHSGSKEDFLNFVIVFSQFHNYLPLEKGSTLYLNKLETPSPKDALCQVWLKLAHWFWRRWKCEKFTTTTTTTTTDNGLILIRKAHLSLRLRWAKKVHSLHGEIVEKYTENHWKHYKIFSRTTSQ